MEEEEELPPEEGGVSQRGEMENGRSEWGRSILDDLPVITILCLLELFSFFFKNLKMVFVSASG